MKRLWTLLLFLTAGPLRAGDLSFEATVDRDTLTMNDSLTLQLSISGAGLSVSRPELPSLPGFRAVFAGQSQNVSFVNGTVSNQVVYTYALEPQAPGEYTLPSLTMEAGGQKASSSPIKIKVLSAGAAPAPRTGGGPAPSDGGRDLFVTTTLDKKNPVVGETVVLSFRFYSRAPLLSQPRYQAPDVTGFLTEDLPPQRQYTEIIGGRRYQVVELRTALYATAPGRLTVGPAALECSVQDFSRESFPGGFPSFFDEAFGAAKRVVLRSDPISVSVAPLPSVGRPPGFKGDVGRFALTARLDKTEAQVHEPVTLTVTVEGEGNIKALSTPGLPPLPEFKTYETLSGLNIAKKDGRVLGSKVFTTVLKPEVTGTLTVPPVVFSYFDPRARIFRTVRSAALSLKVVPGTSSLEPVADSSGAVAVPLSEGVKVIGRDIRYIKLNGKLRRRRPPFTGSPAWVLLNLAPAALFLGLWGTVSFRQHSLANLSGRSFRAALRRAEREVALAQKETASPAAFMDRLQRIYAGFLSAKIGAPAQGLTTDRIEAAMGEAGVPAETRSRARALSDVLDRARFTPGLLTPKDAGDRAAELRQLLRSLETQWKGRP